MSLQREDDLYTVDEFYDVIPDGVKADLIDGVIYVASPDTRRSDQLNGFIYKLMSNFLDIRGLDGHVSGTRYAYRLSEIRAPEPDVAYVRPERVETVITEREGLGPPDIAVEIVSRDSRTRDYNEKKSLYESSGVQEYWLLDRIACRAEFYELMNGRYEMVPLESNRLFRSRVLAGFWLDVDWLFGSKLPNAWTCLQQILK